VIPLPGYSTRRCRAARRSMRRANARARSRTRRRNSPAGAYAQRIAVLAMLRADHAIRRHSGYRRVVAHHPNVSQKTVYEVLDALVGVGLARCVTEGGGAARYEGRPQRHDHAYCLACRLLFDIRAKADETIRSRAEIPKRVPHRRSSGDARRPLRPLRGRLSSRRFRLVASEFPEQHS
jgi:Fe2+ or Zn2+ uptake regulation protein